jgi:TetR/AcrR family transcriptional repressor of mexCD-oprJ operon
MTADGRTAIRDRNGAAILDAAVDVFRADPSACMGEVAAVAGVGRATLYRHYPAREDLVAAIEARVRAAFRALLCELEGSDEAPAVALERFVDGLFALREGAVGLSPRSEARLRAVWAPLRRVLRRWQTAGELDAAVSADWALAAFRALLRAAVIEVDARRLARRDATAHVVSSFLRGLAPA